MSPRGLDGRPVIIGSGIAGLMTALSLAPEPVVLITKASLGAASSSELAQGGLAAALGVDDDPALHQADTVAAGAGLCDVAVARRVAEAAPAAVERLVGFGVRFDRTANGSLALGLEAAHSRRRILHAAGDGTGREIIRALVDRVQSTHSITVLEHVEVRRLITGDGRVLGVLAQHADGPVRLATDSVVIATGGVGGLFADTTNAPGCWGQGLMLAASAGAELADLEFVQFHPTALHGASRPMRLISEAVRGEGAVLVDETGWRFLEEVPGAELAPRDVVTRAVTAHLRNGHSVFLDARRSLGAAFAERFPTIDAHCLSAGIDPARDLVPIRPAAHYHMGGIAVDDMGRSTVEGLWACGEAACTGLHGANRLASNSLVEAAVFADRVAQDISGRPARAVRSCPTVGMPARPDPEAVRGIVSAALGIVRHGDELRRAIAILSPVAGTNDAAALALMIAVAALEREESRGAHWRADFPHQSSIALHSRLTLRDAMAASSRIVGEPASLVRSA
ncbi:L-aspartate oxidase [Nitratireductor sp. ZSWI3]|uniref:L-aspartate oxidase n=1 Tax=Nitratireductor sp. ZSWI3 TaxID=2966359 RepID=UPI00214F95A9|nr:L-aspartate oxidase [Nitratireductor sp. ZSWI3]MCR4264634.1 L-aspartate oxidase [Nitratireductor sp. ZSWI3]